MQGTRPDFNSKQFLENLAKEVRHISFAFHVFYICVSNTPVDFVFLIGLRE